MDATLEAALVSTVVSRFIYHNFRLNPIWTKL